MWLFRHRISITILRHSSICCIAASDKYPIVRNTRPCSKVVMFMQEATQTLLSPEPVSTAGSKSSCVIQLHGRNVAI
jgi:hypothetical protein